MDKVISVGNRVKVVNHYSRHSNKAGVIENAIDSKSAVQLYMVKLDNGARLTFSEYELRRC